MTIDSTGLKEGRKEGRHGGRMEGRKEGRYSMLCFVVSMCGTG
jgi:predicted transposase YdaD